MLPYAEVNRIRFKGCVLSHIGTPSVYYCNDLTQVTHQLFIGIKILYALKICIDNINLALFEGLTRFIVSISCAKLNI